MLNGCFRNVIFASLLLPTLFSCGESVRNWKYAADEKIGIEKRDLFEREVKRAREDQKEVSQVFRDALSRLREVYRVEGGELERVYDRLNDRYQSCAHRVNEVEEGIQDLETIASDLFSEWEREITQISDANLKQQSLSIRRETRVQYEQMIAALKQSHASMKPVLQNFQDHVLFLKHNLNSTAIRSLQGNASKIQADIQSLLTQMDQSIKEAEKFLRTIEQQS